MRASVATLVCLLLAQGVWPGAPSVADGGTVSGREVRLPTVGPAEGGALEQVMARRRSVRDFLPTPLSAAQIGRLLWAAQGSTGRRGLRTAPSAGALYPLHLYVVTQAGVYHHQREPHALRRIREGDARKELARTALGQQPIAEAPAVFAIAADPKRTEAKYGPRAERYVVLEAGHVAQNILLQATAMQLGAVPIGAFHDRAVSRTLRIPKEQTVLYLIPVGWPRG